MQEWWLSQNWFNTNTGLPSWYLGRALIDCGVISSSHLKEKYSRVHSVLAPFANKSIPRENTAGARNLSSHLQSSCLVRIAGAAAFIGILLWAPAALQLHWYPEPTETSCPPRAKLCRCSSQSRSNKKYSLCTRSFCTTQVKPLNKELSISRKIKNLETNH